MDFALHKKQFASVAKKYHLKFIILHGSYATGKERSDSDIDIALVPKREKARDRPDIFQLYADFSAILGNFGPRELDLKLLSKVDPFFRYEVVKTGKLLYGDPLEYEEFKSVTYRLYEDAKPLFELESILSQKYQRHLNQICHAQ